MSLIDLNTTKFGQTELSRILNDINPATTSKSKISSLVIPSEASPLTAIPIYSPALPPGGGATSSPLRLQAKKAFGVSVARQSLPDNT